MLLEQCNEVSCPSYAPWNDYLLPWGVLLPSAVIGLLAVLWLMSLDHKLRRVELHQSKVLLLWLASWLRDITWIRQRPPPTDPSVALTSQQLREWTDGRLALLQELLRVSQGVVPDQILQRLAGRLPEPPLVASDAEGTQSLHPSPPVNSLEECFDASDPSEWTAPSDTISTVTPRLLCSM